MPAQTRASTPIPLTLLILLITMFLLVITTTAAPITNELQPPTVELAASADLDGYFSLPHLPLPGRSFPGGTLGGYQKSAGVRTFGDFPVAGMLGMVFVGVGIGGGWL